MICMTLNAAIIGGKNSGKTTFLILLYAAQIRYSEFSRGQFRFYINPTSLEPVSSEYLRMQMGKWPSDKLVKTSRAASFMYGRVEGAGKKGFFKFLKKTKEPETVSLDFSIYDLSAPEYINVVKDKLMSYLNLSDKIKKLSSSNILIIVFDSTKFKKFKKGGSGTEAGENTDDKRLTNALDNIARRHRKTIYPVVVFTKFDAVPGKTLKLLKLPKKPPIADDLKHREIFAGRLLAKFYPETLAQLKNNKWLGYEPGMHYFSSVKTEENEKGKTVPSLKLTKNAGYVLDCSYDEYIGFIEYLEKVAGLIEAK